MVRTQASPNTCTLRGAELLAVASLRLRPQVLKHGRRVSALDVSGFSAIHATHTYPSRRQIQPPPYSGRLTFRGRLEPCQSTTITPSLWITRPGTYSLGNWKAETEVYEQEETAGGTPAVRHRYLQTPAPGDDVYISVSDIVRR